MYKKEIALSPLLRKSFDGSQKLVVYFLGTRINIIILNFSTNRIFRKRCRAHHDKYFFLGHTANFECIYVQVFCLVINIEEIIIFANDKSQTKDKYFS